MKLHASLRLLAQGPPATDDQCGRLKARFPQVPAEYVDLTREATELELSRGSGCNLRIWGPDGCADMDEGYRISERIPEAVPVGDDGGGRVLLYMRGTRGDGLYVVGLGDLDRDDARWISRDLRGLLSDGEGLNSLWT